MRLSCVALIACAMTLPAAEWSRFRGPNGSGVDASSTGLPTEFGPSSNVAWKADVPFGRSSPVVFGAHLYLTASEGDRLITLCYNVADGKLLWRQAVQKVHKHELFRANDAASPTPAADASGVYVFFADLGLIAYTPDGKERWRHPLGPFANFYGMAPSPVVEGEIVIVQCDQDGESFLLAVDRKSGKQRWKTARPGVGIGWSVPIMYAPAGQEKQIVATGGNRVDCYYLATGEPRWWFPIGSDGTFGVPVSNGESLIFYTTGHDRPAGDSFETLLAKYDTNKDGKLSKEEFQAYPGWNEHFGWIDSDHDGYIEAGEWKKAIEATAGEYGAVRVTPGANTGQLPKSAFDWRVKSKVPMVPALVLYKGIYFMVKEGGIITALDPDTGNVLKQGRAPQSLGDYFASPVAADGKVFLTNAEGKLTVLSAKGDWEVLAVNDLKDEAYATPAIVGSRVYVRTRAALYCFAASK
jgi:outer membrane protein assembly factor BamB